MARNVEIKARATNWDAQLRAARRIAESTEYLSQRDVFYRAANGRLKLRVINDQAGQLIYYHRPNAKAPKLSDYQIVEVSCAESMDAILTDALGRCGCVNKMRTVFLLKSARIHFDEVEGLGRFIEIEVVLEPGMTATDGNQIAHRIMDALTIRQPHLINVAYVDLFAGPVNQTGG